MTKQRNRPGAGVYFVLILLLLCGYYLFFYTMRVPAVSYAQAEELFRQEQVQSFYVKNGSELYLTLRDGTTVRNELGSTDRFREELGELIREQKAAYKEIIDRSSLEAERKHPETGREER